ncbi:MAG: NAD(P)/FAD-dependent oxidoreductase [Candidatus Aminicenantes bacterium]|nr:NAD(P)/FAD-dependent oxidoreductase [Candidatus Aminicenantes bacterium]
MKSEKSSETKKVIILGAGPAGLTAAYEACKRGLHPIVFEKDNEVGGISKTVSYKNYLFDIGGHRFFTKYEEVKDIWKKILGDNFLTRPRLSRIYYNNSFFYYPLKPLNALKNLGLRNSFLVLLSYINSQISPYKNVTNFEEWISNKFGKKLFQIFFKTYTEKVWGIPCKEIQADWAAQRIKSLSLGKAILNSIGFIKRGQVTTLIGEFQYPRRGPGQMWDSARDLVQKQGGTVKLNSKVKRFAKKGNKIISILTESNGSLQEITGDYFLSSIPLKELIESIDPPAPNDVLEAARRLRYRDFFTVGIVINKANIFPDNWIYIHSPEVRVGRIQNYKNWSPEMVPDSQTTSLGLEYFCFVTDEIWKKDEYELIELGKKEVVQLKFTTRDQISDGFVLKSPKTYPIYDEGYQERINIIKNYLSTIGNLQTMGRNGLHRYNNQDHSMLSAILAVRNILGEKYSTWDINIDDEYHEIIEENKK